MGRRQKWLADETGLQDLSDQLAFALFWMVLRRMAGSPWLSIP